MSAELFICPDEDAAAITVEEIRQRFVAAELPCAIEMYEQPWIVFDDHESDLVFTVEENGLAGSSVMQLSVDDDPAFVEQVLTVFESIGWGFVKDAF